MSIAINEKWYGYVYLLFSGGVYKIGRTQNVQARMRQLSTGSPLEIKLVHNIKTPCFVQLEAALHKRFQSKRVSGRKEWFELNADDVALFKSLNQWGRTPKEQAEYDAQTTPIIPVPVPIMPPQPTLLREPMVAPKRNRLPSLQRYVNEALAESGLTHDKAARMAQKKGHRLSAAYLHSISHGFASNPSVRNIKAMAAGLGKPVEELMQVAIGM